jgi:hypothetical protein
LCSTVTFLALNEEALPSHTGLAPRKVMPP